MTESPYFTRKEIACLIHRSVKTVVRNESQLGLDQTKVTINARDVRYRRLPALAALEARGLIGK